MHNKVIAFFFLVLLSGCATQKYAWNGYDDTLYAYYKDPADKERYMAKLKETILKSEQSSAVPPGIYAEYGFMFYEMQDYAQAIVYYGKEKDLWPESKVFMDKMIANAQKLLDRRLTKDPS